MRVEQASCGRVIKSVESQLKGLDMEKLMKEHGDAMKLKEFDSAATRKAIQEAMKTKGEAMKEMKDFKEDSKDMKGMEGMPRMPMGQGHAFLMNGMGRGRLGVRAEDLSSDLAPYFDAPSGSGALVMEVLKATKK